MPTVSVCPGGQPRRGDGLGVHRVPGPLLEVPEEGDTPSGRLQRLHQHHRAGDQLSEPNPAATADLYLVFEKEQQHSNR